jgi:predicted MFS family arabinose efflux permease
MTTSGRSKALRFVVIVGIMSFFADFTYEGARSVLGPYLAFLGASATVVGVASGFGEFVGYALRLVSGRTADKTHLYWPIAIAGYVVQMAAVPALALAGSWPIATLFLVLERAGRAVRNPPRDVMLSHAGQQMGGYGWTFGLHEALDQFGALAGPLLVALALARHGGYRTAFALLGVPAAITLSILTLARILYPSPQNLATQPPVRTGQLPRTFWLYLAGAALVGAGFADFPLLAFHLQKTSVASQGAIAVFYSVAMATGGLGSLLFGRLFDRHGIVVLVPLTVVSALFAPLMFLGGFWMGLAGAAVWGLGTGVHESIIPAAVAPMVAPERRASAYGLFTAVYGVFWFLGSASIGLLYDVSRGATITFCLVLELAAIPFFLLVRGRSNLARGAPLHSQSKSAHESA